MGDTPPGNPCVWEEARQERQGCPTFLVFAAGTKGLLCNRTPAVFCALEGRRSWHSCPAAWPDSWSLHSPPRLVGRSPVDACGGQVCCHVWCTQACVGSAPSSFLLLASPRSSGCQHQVLTEETSGLVDRKGWCALISSASCPRQLLEVRPVGLTPYDTNFCSS